MPEHVMLTSESPTRSLRHRVLETIQDAIWSGRLKPGAHLVETEVAEQLGVSRGPVREALRELEKRGLITNIPNRGAFVVQWSIEDVVDMFGVRRVLEGLAARLAARRINPADLAELEHIVEQMRREGQAGDPLRIVDCEMQFHRALVEFSGNKQLIRIMDDISAQVRMYIAAAEVRYRLYADLAAIAEQHEPIVAAIRARDPDAAAREAEDHVQGAVERLVDRMLRESLG